MSLSLNERWEKLSEEQEKTVQDAYDKLNQFGKVMVIRPTGFGKTYMLVEKFAKKYIKQYPKKKVAYIYPLDIIVSEITSPSIKINADGEKIKEPSKYMKDKVLKIGKNIEFISYQALSLKYHTEGEDYWRQKFGQEYSLIILDEVHRAGSETFAEIYDTFYDLIKSDGIHMIGVTATPNRMDDDDNKPAVIDRIFDNIKTYKYELDDSIRDGLIPEIIIPASIYQVDELIEDLRAVNSRKYGKDFDDKSFNVEIGKLRETIGTEGETIYSALPQAGYDLLKNKYYKFIIFFTNIKDVASRGPEIEQWFNSAFNKIAKSKNSLKKDFNIRSYYIVSQDTEEGEITELTKRNSSRTFFKQTKKVETITEEDYNVDLLFTVDMINMGYHVSNITGIMMLRGTKSEIVYYQQLGRALSVRAEYNPIVYDMTNNYKEKFWFKKDKSDRVGPGLGRGSSGEHTELSGLQIKEMTSRNVFDEFMERWGGNTNQSIKSKLEYLYIEKQAPIFIVAKALNKTCTAVAKELKRNNIPIRTEDKLAKFLINRIEKNKSKKDKIQDKLGSKILTPSNKELNELRKEIQHCNDVINISKSEIRLVNSSLATPEQCKYVRKDQACLFKKLLKEGV